MVKFSPAVGARAMMNNNNPLKTAHVITYPCLILCLSVIKSGPCGVFNRDF